MPTPIVLAMALLLASPSLASTQADPLACKQEPGNRHFWVERAFCDLPAHGPDRAVGIVIWNHGIMGSTQSWMAPAPPVFRLIQARGWDVVMLKRHHLAETGPGSTLYRTVQRTLEEVAAARKQGYRKVTLEAIDTVSDIDAAVAFAPGVRSSSAAGALDPSVTDRILQRAKVGRLALVFPKHDALINYLERGENAQATLSRRSVPYLLVDETGGISGHGGAVSGRFALRYGLCLADFLSTPSPPAGRFTCPPVADEWAIVRELLLPPAAARAGFVRDGPMAGPRWALLEDSVVLVAPVDAGAGRLQLLYRSTGFTGGLFDVTVHDGALRAVLSNKATVIMKPEGDGTLTWTSSDGSRSINGRLLRGREEP